MEEPTFEPGHRVVYPGCDGTGTDEATVVEEIQIGNAPGYRIRFDDGQTLDVYPDEIVD